MSDFFTSGRASRYANIFWLGVRATFLSLPARPLPPSCGPAFIVALVLLDVAVVSASGYFAFPDHPSFEAIGLPATAAGCGLVALVCALGSRMFNSTSRLVDLLAVLLATLCFIDLIWLGLQFLPALLDRLDNWWPARLPLVGIMAPWIGVALGQAMSLQTRGFRRRFMTMLLGLMLIGAPLLDFDRSAALWVSPEPAASADVSAEGISGGNGDPASTPDAVRADEAMVYGENDRLEQSLDLLAERQPGRINVYFVGFAGNGEQMVFTREITYVKSMFDQRFAGAGHTVALLNNMFTPGRVPIATAVSLQQTLAAIGQHMNDDDVLVLFMTSHGSREAGVNVALPPFDFGDIDPKSLKTMLDESHIKQRVVIISACYSGIFVAPLANPNTLVITAADATHTSFGCSNEADFTYFGEAYFHDALTSTNSFAEAFDRAVPLIKQRESDQGFGHSNPQMVMGEHIRATLDRLTLQLTREQPAPGSAPH